MGIDIAKIRHMREQRNMTQQQVAARLNLTYQAYQRREYGEVYLSANEAGLLAALFGVGIGELYVKE